MPDYTITLKIRSRKRNTLKDIDRIFKTGIFQESFEFAISEHILSRLRLAYLDVSEIDVTAQFRRKRKQSAGVASNFSAKQAPPQAPKKAVKKAVKVRR